jgi:pimeloyl-ACP methyl ester carboxylesterase
VRRALRLGVFAACALAAGYAAISVYAAFQFTHAARTPVTRAPREIAERVEDISFRASDGLLLRGWYFPGAGARAAVLVHGKDSNRLDSDNLAFVARTLLAAGYAVLAFDLRGHGASDGDRFSLGHHERKDVAAAIDHLVGRGHPLGSVVVYGESMGASTAVQTLRLRPAVGAVVADSGYADGPSIVDEAGPAATGLPGIFTGGIVLAARTLLGLDADAVDPERVVRDSPGRPFLFVHCERDDLIRVHHARRLRDASAHPGSDLWVVPGCGHVGAAAAAPGEYARRLLAFLDARLRRDAPAP